MDFHKFIQTGEQRLGGFLVNYSIANKIIIQQD